MTGRREWETLTNNAAVNAAMRRHPSRFSLDEVNPAWTDCDQLAAWTARLDAAPAEPELSARHKLVAVILIDVAALLVLLVAGRIVWQGISTVVGL